MPGKPNSYLKSLIVDLPRSSKIRQMIESDDDLDDIVAQARLEKKCWHKYDEVIHDGETGKSLLIKFGYGDKLKECELEDRQEMFGFMMQIEDVSFDLAEDEDEEDD